MAARKRKIRRATLRGWWKPLPFLLLPFCVLFAFASLEGRRLQTEYDIIDLITKIRAVNLEIGILRDERRELNRIELLDERAPSLNLVEPDPEQRVVLPKETIRAALRVVQDYSGTVLYRSGQPRTVLYDLRPIEERMLRAREE